MFKKIILSLICIWTVVSSHAEMIKTNEIERVRDYVTADTLLLFNVTDILYEPATALADNQWRLYFADRVTHVIPDSEKAQKYINQVKNTIVNQIPKKAVEEATPKLIQELQAKKIAVLGITQKKISTDYAANFGEITSSHLNSIGIHLEKTLNYLALNKSSSSEYAFAYGIIFTQKQPEGPALLAFLKALKQKPARIIMVDNEPQALENVAEALAPIGIPFFGIRYNHSDERKKQFDPTLGTIEYLEFRAKKSILSNEEAKKIKAAHPGTNYQQLLEDLIRKDNELQTQ